MVSDRLGPGSLNGELVAGMCSYLGLEGGSVLASYHTALTVALESLRLEPGSAVVVSALAPAVYRDVVARLGLVTVLADVEEKSGTLDPEDAARCVEQGAAAILVHYPFGLIPDVAALSRLGVPLIEDLSLGVGGYAGEQKCGTFGEVAVVSLEPEAILTAAGGGLVAAASKAAARRVSTLPLSTYARLADLNSALALAQLREIEIFVAGRKQIAQVYHRALQGSRHRAVLQAGEGENVYSAFPVMLESGMREARRYARRKGVEAAAAFEGSVLASEPRSAAGSSDQSGMPQSAGPADLSRPRPADDDVLEGRVDSAGEEKGTGPSRADLPRARGILMRCLLFPLYPTLGKARVEAVARVLSTLP
jgi:dTDP-4-amino-4,6-dideoxygalactose transaminase